MGGEGAPAAAGMSGERAAAPSLVWPPRPHEALCCCYQTRGRPEKFAVHAAACVGRVRSTSPPTAGVRGGGAAPLGAKCAKALPSSSLPPLPPKSADPPASCSVLATAQNHLVLSLSPRHSWAPLVLALRTACRRRCCKRAIAQRANLRAAKLQRAGTLHAPAHGARR